MIRDRIRELRRVRAGDLVENPKNWRRHPKAQSAALKAMLEEVGIADAVLCREREDGSLMLIDGHLRKDLLPDETLPALILDVTEEEADKLLLSLDPLAALAEMDGKALRSLMDSVQWSSADVAAALKPLWPEAHAVNLQEPPARIDQAVALRAKWGTETGQIWAAGATRILCGDSREKPAVARLWRQGGQKIRMVWTDPPYGVDYAGKNAYLNRGDRGNRIQTPIRADKQTPEECQALVTAALAVACEHAMPGAACYCAAPSGPLLPFFIAGFYAGGFDFRHLLVWVKQQMVIGMSDYHYRHEPILYGWRPGGRHYFIEDRSKTTIFEVDKPHVSDLHPTTKPVELIASMILNSSIDGELVYDPFAGAGSTLLAAAQLNRAAYAVEIDAGYVAVTLQRLSEIGLAPVLESAAEPEAAAG